MHICQIGTVTRLSELSHRGNICDWSVGALSSFDNWQCDEDELGVGLDVRFLKKHRAQELLRIVDHCCCSCTKLVLTNIPFNKYVMNCVCGGFEMDESCLLGPRAADLFQGPSSLSLGLLQFENDVGNKVLIVCFGKPINGEVLLFGLSPHCFLHRPSCLVKDYTLIAKLLHGAVKTSMLILR